MNDGPPPPPSLDSSAIAFPMDVVTLGDMRRREPELFAGPFVMSTASNSDVLATHSIERLLAEKAFARAAGFTEPFPGESRAALVDDLDEAYRGYGISSGIQATRELVRKFEAAAAAQAELLLGRQG